MPGHFFLPPIFDLGAFECFVKLGVQFVGLFFREILCPAFFRSLSNEGEIVSDPGELLWIEAILILLHGVQIRVLEDVVQQFVADRGFRDSGKFRHSSQRPFRISFHLLVLHDYDIGSLGVFQYTEQVLIVRTPANVTRYETIHELVEISVILFRVAET